MSKPSSLIRTSKETAYNPRNMAPVLVDDRAGSGDLVNLAPLKGHASLTRMDSGDVMVIGNGPDDSPMLVGVEVKSVFDLLSSISTGRLAGKQIPGMLGDYDVSWLVSYGWYKCGTRGELRVRRKGKWVAMDQGGRSLPYSYLEGFLLTVAALGIKVKHVYGNKGDLARWLGVLAAWWGKQWQDHGSLKAFDQSGQPGLLPTLNSGTALRARVAATLPGVGYKRAIAVAHHFPSVRAMMLAGPKEWMEVPGVGKTIAKTVEEAVK